MEEEFCSAVISWMDAREDWTGDRSLEVVSPLVVF